MDSMTKLASALSDGPEEQLEETFERMTLDQLDDLVKNGGEGSFIGQVALEQAWEEKTAMAVQMGIDMAKEASMEKQSVLDILVGHHFGKEQKKRGEEYSFGAPQLAASLLVPGGAGYQIGRYFGHQSDVKKGKKVKTSAPLGMLAGAGKAIGRAAMGGAAKGAIGGAATGAISGAIKNPGVDPATGQQRSRVGGALKGMAGGAALGAAGGAAVGGGKMALTAATRANAGVAQTVGNLENKARGAFGAAKKAITPAAAGPAAKASPAFTPTPHPAKLVTPEAAAARRAATGRAPVQPAAAPVAAPKAVGAGDAAAGAAQAKNARLAAVNQSRQARGASAATLAQPQAPGFLGRTANRVRGLDPTTGTRAGFQKVSSVDFSKLAGDFKRRTR